MNKVLVDRGIKKIENSYMKDALKNGLSNTILEVVGATDAHYYGVSKFESIHSKDNKVFRLKYYKYDNLSLKECTFAQAITTKEFTNDQVLIFSEAPESDRFYYVVEIVS